MKRFLLYIAFVLAAFSGTAQQQPGNPKRAERIEALYVAYITKQCSLTSDEAQRFWPLHAQYDAEIKAAASRSGSTLDNEQDQLNIKKKYLPGFSKIIGADRANLFFQKDAEFRKMLVEKLRQMRQQRKGNVKAGGGMKRQDMLDN
jgi:hypothetical protein